MYELVSNKCKEKSNDEEKSSNETVNHCDITRSSEKFDISNTIKFDMKSSINIQKGVDVFMKIENFGSAHPAMVSLHYSTNSSDTNINKLDNEPFYKHFIEDADKNYNFSAPAIKFIIALYVDSNQGGNSKMKKVKGGGTRKIR
jgi:hypothetical protein